MSSALADRNRRVGMYGALLVAGMVGMGYASVPLYRLFCQVTGFEGTVSKNVGGAAPGEVVGKIVNVRFDANVSPKLPWSFAPEKRIQRTAIGARQMAFFNATNDSDHEITGSATFNVTPFQAGGYFTKIQCFCFTKQTLKPHETVRMPVVYYIDPKFLDDPDANDISEITLSYTFYPVPTDQSDAKADKAVDSPATAG
jgi:cytochrome c oxidase assembly protein subunit 11